VTAVATLCEVCVHRDRFDMERRASSETRLALASAYDVSVYSLARHFRKHVPKALARSVELRKMASGDWLAGQLLDTLARADRIARDARTDKRPAIELAAVRERIRCLELIAKAMHHMPGDVSVTINTLEIAQAQRVVNVMLPILAGHPELQQRVVAALTADENGAAP
jgi:hypothetical protein